MSYILDALKKAEAERNLGGVPGVHAQAQVSGKASAPARPWAAYAIGAAIMALAGAGFLLLKSVHAPATPAIALTAAPISTTATHVPNTDARAITAPAGGLAPSATMPIVAAPATSPAAVGLPSAVPSVIATPPQRVASRPSRPIASPPVPAPVNTTTVNVEPIPTQRELPENIQRELPPVAIGGYIYSGNQADRQLLINKNLRREGEEVAPGLLLEQMTPHSAVLNYKGYRYRVTY